MYRFERYRQLGLADFNQPVGFPSDPETVRLFRPRTGGTDHGKSVLPVPYRLIRILDRASF